MKKLLALVLALVMSMSLVTISNAAFSDAKEIKHAEAVGVMNALGVINGMPDGSFAPDGNVTRAEMAKMISIIMLGDVDASAFVGTSTGLTDIKGHWAEGYIQYCYSQGIIAGKGDGTFAPNANVTTVEAAKMLLGAIGYNSNVQGYVGSDWAINVTRDAQISGFFKDLKGLVSGKALSRDEAAQMIWNALQAPTVVKTATINSEGKVSYTYSNKNESNQWNASLLNKTFDAVTYEGILTGSGKWGASTNKDNYSIQAKKLNGNDLTTSSSPALNAPLDFKWKGMDLTAMAGEYVKVVYNTEDKTTYGVFSVADMNTVVYSTTDKVEDIKSDSIKIDGVKYDTDSLSYTGSDTVADTVKFIDNDGDGKLNLAIPNPVGVYKVTYVGSDNFTLAGTGHTNSANSYVPNSMSNKKSDVKAYDGMAKDDIVVVKKDLYTGKMSVEKADVVSGTVTGTKTGKYLVNGAWYQVMNGTAPIALGNTIDFYAIGETIYYTKVTSGAKDASNFAMAITKGNGDALSAAQVKLLFSDGTKKVVTLSNDSAAATAGSLYTFETNNDGEYKLTALAAAVGDYTKTGTDTVAISDGKIATYGGTTIADDAVVFLFKGHVGNDAVTNDGKIMTGKELKKVSTVGTSQAATTTTAGTSVATDILNTGKGGYTYASNGLTKVAILAVATTKYQDAGKDAVAWPTVTSAANYGFIVSDPYKTSIDGTKYQVYQVWDGSNTVTYKVKTDASAFTGVKYQVIGYDVVSADTIKNVTLIGTTETAVVGLNGEEITFSDDATNLTAGTVGKLDGNTRYLYVNTAAEKAEEIGVSGGSVERANNPSGSIYVKNVLVLVDTDKTLDLIVVDTNNKMALQSASKGDLTISGTIPAGVTITIDGVEYTATTTNVVKPGDVVKVSRSASAALSSLTVADTTLTSGNTTVPASGSYVSYIADGSDLTITIA